MFGQILAKLRKEKNLSQYKLAELMNFSRGQIANYEQGSREPDFETLERFADFFGVSTDYLLGRNDNLDRIRKFSEVFEKNKENVLFLDNNLTDMKKYRNNMLKLLKSINPTDPELEKQAKEIQMLINYMDDSIKGIEEMKEVIQDFNNILVETDSEEIDKE